MTTITRRLIESDYNISDDDVRELCTTKLASGEVDANLGDGYFKVLYRRTVDYIKFPSVESRLAALEVAHNGMYGIALDVVSKLPECMPLDYDSAETRKAKTLERNKRTNYARSAKSVIKGAIEAGIEIENTQAKDIGKTALEKQTKEAKPSTADTKDVVRALVNKLERAMDRLKVEDEGAYQEWAEWLSNEYRVIAGV